MPTATVDKDVDVRSLIGWVGGKKALARTIIALLPGHECYVEVFGGAGWVLFRKDPVKTEVYNDLDGRLVALFRSVKYHAEEFCREVDFILTSRQEFCDFLAQPGLTEIQRAARFYYIVRLSYGCKCVNLGAGPRGVNRLLMEKTFAHVDEVRARLERVVVERLDFEELLAKYDTDQTAFYVDPPYVGSEREYRVRFAEDDHLRLRAALAQVQGRWLLTYNDCEWVRDTYADARRYEFNAPYSIAKGGRVPGHQLIITNYRLTKAQLRAAPKLVEPVRKGR
ncbi:MAG: DNA adenine methylase [Candidatus Brocadiae bacterium]|nr:DNA adenine methylase [Candidatus Brocadiia bacterium]